MSTRKIDERQEFFTFMTEPGHLQAATPPFQPKKLFELAARGVFLGTSSWKYRGWEGMIYRGGYASEAQFQRQSLKEYTSFKVGTLACISLTF